MHHRVSPLEVRSANARIETEDARRRLRDDAHRAALRVAAKQGALRTLQHFDPFHIEERGAEPLGTAEEHTVHIDAYTGIPRRLVGVE
jgi:hypothetical protein